MESLGIYAIASLLSMLMVGFYLSHVRKREKAARAILHRTMEQGLLEPPSLHPLINQDLCIGSGACVKACPEKNVLGLNKNKAVLIQPGACIGHGACASACPVSAIDLVFGSARRGIDIPRLNPDFQSNMPGLFIAGELGGMGLIRNAVRQGSEAVLSIAGNLLDSRDRKIPDLLIVGAGPAGIAASLQAQNQGLNCITIDQEEAGGAIRHYPRRKLVMAQAFTLPGEEPFREKEVLKEDLLIYVDEVLRKRSLEIQSATKLVSLEQRGGVFHLHCRQSSHALELKAHRVLLAIGRRGSPRKLGIPGQDDPRVRYALPDPREWAGRSCVVVGGGDSALEAALRLSDEADTSVALVYRHTRFDRARQGNREKVLAAASSGRLRLHLNTQPLELRPEGLRIESEQGEQLLRLDLLCVQIGGELPTALLRHAGIHVDTHYGRHIQRVGT